MKISHFPFNKQVFYTFFVEFNLFKSCKNCAGEFLITEQSMQTVTDMQQDEATNGLSVGVQKQEIGDSRSDELFFFNNCLHKY